MQMDRYNKAVTRTHISLHTHYFVASTWPGDHQENTIRAYE